MYDKACKADKFLKDYGANSWFPNATQVILKLLLFESDHIVPALDKFLREVMGSSVDTCKKNDCLNVCYD